MIRHILWIYMSLDPPDSDPATRDHEVMTTINRVSPKSGTDFRSDERYLSFAFASSWVSLDKTIIKLLDLPYVKRVSVTRL